VDDIIITGNSDEYIEATKVLLSRQFKMKDLRVLRYFLGVEVDRQDGSLSLTQHKYTLDLLDKADMKDRKPLSTPSVLNHKLSSQDGEAYKDSRQYRSLGGMLQYLTFTRPNIVYAVNQVSQFMHDP
jgi:hypothetical protein